MPSLPVPPTILCTHGRRARTARVGSNRPIILARHCAPAKISSPAEKSNVVGYLIKAIREEYTVIKGKPENKNAFNQFPQREYDFEELEKEILGEN